MYISVTSPATNKQDLVLTVSIDEFTHDVIFHFTQISVQNKLSIDLQAKECKCLIQLEPNTSIKGNKTEGGNFYGSINRF